MNRVAIIGLGLMGGSLGLALKNRGGVQVVGSARRPETRKMALSMGAVDSACEDPSEALKGSDVVVFCTPVCSIPEIARQCKKAFDPRTIVTDVGSTKGILVSEMDDVLRGTDVIFVGSHPMAGSEKTGIESARRDLYGAALVALTPSAHTPAWAIQEISAMWKGVGARVLEVAPGKHDELVARTSHLPHLVSALLALTAGREFPEHVAEFCGPGFRDTTRIAGGSPEMWQDIVRTNRNAILAELAEYRQKLDALTTCIQQGDDDGVRRFLSDAQSSRRQLVD
jgi:prephenate dehydrogenase